MSASKLLVLLAVITFVLAGLGVTVASFGTLALVAFGLAFFAAAHLVP